MPPETKPTISSLAEMTCENCVYSEPHEDKRIRCHSVRADDWDIYHGSDFCSKGKWMVYLSYDFELMDEKETHPSNYDNCYYLFKEDNKCHRS